MPRITLARPALAAAGAFLAAGATAGAQVTAVASSNQVMSGFFGGSVSGIPDVNGDGRGDIVVGAPNETVNGIQGAGRVYIHSGANGALLRVLQSPSPRFNGNFGIAVAGSPDINGDGRGDVIVGAANENDNPIASGRAYVFSGATGALFAQMISPNRQTGGGFGTSVAWVPDVNGDGFPDAVVGAPNETSGNHPAGAGRAYIYNGRTGQLLTKLIPYFPRAQGSFGFSVAGIPDRNNDGRGDVVVGAPREGVPENSGRIHWYSGFNGVRLFTNQSANIAENGFFGYSLATIPDASGDLFPDIVVGAPYEHPLTSPHNAGRAYIYNGRTGSIWKKIVPIIQMPNMEFGVSVGGIADMNGDGRGDAIVGSWQETPANSPAWCGRAHVHSGITGARLTTFASPNRVLQGRFGVAVAGVPDTNANGRGDVLIGASAENGSTGASRAGRAYLIRY
ncbi:MAG: integrin alpha [Phycisphaerales bacterium]